MTRLQLTSWFGNWFRSMRRTRLTATTRPAGPTGPMIVTVLEARIPAESMKSLVKAHASARHRRAPGIVRSDLVQHAGDPSLFRIQTIWRDRAALDDARRAGTMAGVRMFRAAGAEPILAVFEVASTIE